MPEQPSSCHRQSRLVEFAPHRSDLGFQVDGSEKFAVSRRTAFLASASLLVGAGSSVVASDAIETHSLTMDGTCSDAQPEQAVAAVCQKASLAISRFVESQTKQNASGALLEVCIESARICSITARVLTDGPTAAPALCQSCADHCDAAYNACQQLVDTSHTELCMAAVQACANACRTLILTRAA